MSLHWLSWMLGSDLLPSLPWRDVGMLECSLHVSLHDPNNLFVQDVSMYTIAYDSVNKSLSEI